MVTQEGRSFTFASAVTSHKLVIALQATLTPFPTALHSLMKSWVRKSAWVVICTISRGDKLSRGAREGQTERCKAISNLVRSPLPYVCSRGWFLWLPQSPE